ncbi:glyceraldehyde-3-phosphate dehydrogenase [Thalassobius vesicularis]|uniref:Glyceraldehyde-3-phosphate dehydrogenase n=1 Tax=Thalassobius vesicularis TaxID=1294297 RepID=A0A4S3M9F2_9RHOB|nr:glyceraldehyde-3-phosphate dehydrogenase [Thalassobius vesicularis]THD74698.1 glyceraldehyde-3-phosphate dehydrogenase [Thalassobius vesicularis]
MTNRIAAIMAICITGLIVADIVLHDGIFVLFVMKKLAKLLDWMAFWR